MRNVSDLVVHAGVLVLMSPNLKDAYFSVGLWCHTTAEIRAKPCHKHSVTSLLVYSAKTLIFPSFEDKFCESQFILLRMRNINTELATRTTRWSQVTYYSVLLNNLIANCNYVFRF